MAPQMMCTLGRYLSEPEQIVLRCERLEDASELIERERRAFRPYASVLALTDEAVSQMTADAGFLASLERQGRATIYGCRNFVCELPEVVAAGE